MANIWFDHFITYSNVANIDHYLKEYAAQGFLPEDRTFRHNPGLRNGFIFLGSEYIEFCWVEDEALFAKADAEEKMLRASPRPFGIGMITDDINTLHTDWMAQGFSVPEIWSKAPRDASPDTPPAWTFQDIPDELLPGASCFALTYHNRTKSEEKNIKIHPNTIYAISGVTFVSKEPEARAVCWRNLLAPDKKVTKSRLGCDVTIGSHRALWMKPETYQSTYGLDWIPAPHVYGEIAVLHLLASDLDTVKRILEQAGRRVFSREMEGHTELVITPDVRDGFIFSIRQQSTELWSQERMARTGEKIKLV